MLGGQSYYKYADGLWIFYDTLTISLPAYPF